MTKLSTKLRIMSLALALILISLGDLYGGADWKLFSESKRGLFYYDLDSFTRPANDIVRVWVAVYPSENSISSIEELFGDKFEALGYWLGLAEIHCRNKSIRFKSQECYSSDGAYIGSFFSRFPTPWQEIEPANMQWNILGAQVLEGLCNK
jgi:hypothetical protein